MQNFDPQAVMASVQDTVTRIEAVETVVEEIANIVRPLQRILAPFLPKSVNDALAEIPALEAEMSRLKDFINSVMPQLETLVDVARPGPAQLAGVVDPALNTLHIDPSRVGEFIVPPNATGDNGELPKPQGA